MIHGGEFKFMWLRFNSLRKDRNNINKIKDTIFREFFAEVDNTLCMSILYKKIL